MSSFSGLDLDKVLDVFAERLAFRMQGLTPTRSAQIEPRLLSVEQAARYLGRTKFSVQHLIRVRAFPIFRHGRRVFIDRKDLDAWVEDNKQSGI
jgi:excisionase family DNA binding protein